MSPPAWPALGVITSVLVLGSLSAQSVWSPAGKAPTDLAPQVAFDPALAGLLSFGPGPTGQGPAGQRSETWLFVGGAWNRLSPTTSPGTWAYHALATDWGRSRIVLFGGIDTNSPGGFSDQTWEWDGANWSQATPATVPPARQGHAMTYDHARAVVVLFGGAGPFGALLGDTWEWDGVDWRQRSPAASPGPRVEHEMAYDSARGAVLLFGGSTGAGVAGDLWSWDGSTWNPLSGQIPPRSAPGMAFDDQRGVLIVHGGSSQTWTLLGDLWEWDGTSWIQRMAAGPSARWRHALVHDPLAGGVVLFGGTDARGASSGTWIWDGAQWADLGTESPSPRFDPAMARSRAGVVHFGGFCFGMQDDTWEWDGTRWIERFPASRPPGRCRHAMVRDETRGRVVLFGGSAGQGVELADTWEWDGTDWQAMSPTVSPPAREFHRMAGDHGRGRVVLFGGLQASSVIRADAWERDGATWTYVGGGPPARFAHGMAYDDARGVTVVYGGRGLGRDLDDTWEWDGVRWQQARPANRPPARTEFVMVHDEARARTVVYGGRTFDGRTVYSDTWEWDGIDWLQRAGTMPLGGRVGAVAAWDPVRRRTLLHGGFLASTGGIVASHTAMQTWDYGPVSPADIAPFGTGCAGTAGAPVLAATGLPWLGDPVLVELSTLPSSAAATFLLGSSSTTWQGMGLPIGLGPVGMPGCSLLVSPDVLVPVQSVAGRASLRLTVPAAPSLVSVPFFAQGLVRDPGANQLGMVVSNGLAATVGSR